MDEVVIKRRPPLEKVWETVGVPRLLVIAAYRMGVEITPQGAACALRVFIDYELPAGSITRWLGRLFGSFYARWCVQQMLTGAAAQFPATPLPHPVR